MKIKDLVQRVNSCMDKEDYKDAIWRLGIVSTQISPVGSYVTHDQETNPNARPYGSPEEEHLAYGQLLVQIAGLAQSRNINLEKSIEMGLRNWEESDWKSAIPQEAMDKIKGIIGCEGYYTGEAVLLISASDLEKDYKNKVVVAKYADAKISEVIMRRVGAIVTDHGGKVSHAAVIAREYNIPCIVGTGNATKLIKEGQKVIVNSTEGYVLLE